ncbi:putative UPF0481 protein [Tanacetum coccineum]
MSVRIIGSQSVCLTKAELNNSNKDKGLSTGSIAPTHDLGFDLPPTVAATKNPTSKIVYNEYNHERYPPGDPCKRAFAYFVLTGGSRPRKHLFLQIFSDPGGGINQIPFDCTILGDVRLTPFYNVEDVIKKLNEYVEDLNTNIEKLPTRRPVSKYTLPDENLRGRFDYGGTTYLRPSIPPLTRLSMYVLHATLRSSVLVLCICQKPQFSLTQIQLMIMFLAIYQLVAAKSSNPIHALKSKLVAAKSLNPIRALISKLVDKKGLENTDPASHSIVELDRSGMNFKPHQEDEWSMAIKFQSSLFAYLPGFWKDIAKLVESKVLVNMLGSNQEAAEMINKICKNINITDFYYNNPWSAIALVAAIILFSLTVVQTVYTIRAT